MSAPRIGDVVTVALTGRVLDTRTIRLGGAAVDGIAVELSGTSEMAPDPDREGRHVACHWVPADAVVAPQAGDYPDPWVPGSGGIVEITPVPPPAPVRVDTEVIAAFVEWCDGTGEHHGTGWEPLLEALRGTL